MDDLRVLMLNYEFPPLGGGAGRATSYLLEAFAARGSVQVDLVTSSATSRIERVRLGPGIEAIRLPVGKRRRHYWTARELARWSSAARGHARRLARERRYDLCHCWSGWPAGLIGAGLRPRLPYLVGLRGSDVPGYSRRLRYLDPVVFRPLSRRIWRRAAAITCLSHDLRALAARTAPGLDMHVVRNGVDCDRFRPGPAPETFTILFVGRLVDRKGVVHLLQAFARLASSGPPCRLLVAGDGPLRGSLGDVARRLGVDSAVTFLDIVDHERLPELYRQASVLAMPSYEEALGNAVLEGMAAGLAIVTTPTGAAEVIDGNGVIVDKAQVDPMVEAFVRYRDDPALLDRHRRRSRSLAERLTWEAAAEAHLAIYRGIAARRPAPSPDPADDASGGARDICRSAG